MSLKGEVVFLPLGIIIVIILFSLKSFFTFDTDFFWELRMGRVILSSGIPRTDPFSYTMPNYPYIDHSWFSGVMMATAYPVIGKVGLAIFASSLAILALAISFSLAKAPRKYFLLPLLLCLPIMYVLMAIRPLVLTWFFLALLLKIILTKDIWKKWRYAIPILFIPWVNLHGGFAIGLFTLGLLGIARTLVSKRLAISELAILIASLFATFLTPYGPSVWKEVFATTSSLSLQFRISEWLPTALVIFEPAFFTFAFLTTVMVFKYRHRFAQERLWFYFFFLGLAIIAIRHVPLFIIVALPMAIDALGYFANDAGKINHGSTRFQESYTALIFASLLIFAIEISFFLIPFAKNQFSDDPLYPKGAASFLADYKPSGHIFTSWVWGGYLLWELPDQKDFVDGRMASWGWEKAKVGQVDPPPYLYKSIVLNTVDYRPVFEQFDIDTVVWPNSLAYEPNRGPKLIYQLLNFLKNYGIIDTSSQDFLNRLIKDGWRVVYKDSTAVVLSRGVTMK